jgi:uracil-DNA glycosylase
VGQPRQCGRTIKIGEKGGANQKASSRLTDGSIAKSHPKTWRCNAASHLVSFSAEDNQGGGSGTFQHRMPRYSTELNSSTTMKEPREIGSLQALRGGRSLLQALPDLSRRDASGNWRGAGGSPSDDGRRATRRPGGPRGTPIRRPCRRVLDRAIAEAGIDRGAVFVTNAVKHFKSEPRGKRRLHKKPNAYDIEQCRWWNEMERKIVEPRLVFALGATAARSLLGRAVTISKVRGQLLMSNGLPVVVTIHPSYVLRIEEQEAKQTEYERLVADLKFGVGMLREYAT